MHSTKRQVCPLCEKAVRKRLIHLRVDHEIENIQEFMDLLQEVSKKEENRRQFAEYVTQLQIKKKQGSISAEDYRELMTQWVRNHK